MKKIIAQGAEAIITLTENKIIKLVELFFIWIPLPPNKFGGYKYITLTGLVLCNSPFNIRNSTFPARDG